MEEAAVRAAKVAEKMAVVVLVVATAEEAMAAERAVGARAGA